MKIVLEELQHQKEALKRINDNFPSIDSSKNDALYYANPLIKHAFEENHFIDIKMETGTGKTYVYTRMMYELHKCGIFKFVVIVPSPSIKEGTKSFIESDYAKQHFSQFYENTHIQLNVINNGDFKAKGGRKNFPSQLTEFIEGSRVNSHQIEVLLINAGMLNSISMKREDYDQTIAGGETSPIKAIAATRPVVIIDEPHRFAEGSTGYKNIMKLKPQSIIRFGATFPQKKVGRGKNAVENSQYYQGKPQYNLNAVESFNQGLVKGVDVIYPTLSNEIIKDTYKVKSVGKNELILQDMNGKENIVRTGENLAVADNRFEGSIIYEGVSKKQGKLSNDLNLVPGIKLIPGTFTESYQERIIKQAIDKHFEIEERNFLRKNNLPKIKTLSLFFIDSVDSYGRKKTDGTGREKGWLIEKFENLLREKLNDRIKYYSHAMIKREKEYYNFLQVTLKSLNSEHQQVYAGYFSGDNGRKSQDDDIQAEVDDILKNKEKMLSFKDKDGNWITRRFLFSKWTLREGWDNPNVFVIAKLRTSGSENSKIQEVGRGLRLPVDENGNRVHQDEFASRLSFLIGYDERNFANTLINEINNDVDFKLSEKELDENTIRLIVEERQKKYPKFDADRLRNDLGEHHIIDYAGKFSDKVEFNGKIMSGFEALEELYPVVKQKKVASDKVRDMRKHPQSIEVTLKKENWNKLREIWLKLVRRSMVVFDRNQKDQVKSIVKSVFIENSDNYVKQQVQNIKQRINIDGKAVISEQKEVYEVPKYETMKYGKFLEQISRATGLQPSLINEYVIKGMKLVNNDKDFINENTMNNLIDDFNKQFNSFFVNFYHYEPLDFNASTSVYDYEKEDFVDRVSASTIGIHSISAVEADNKYLYDRPPLRYDSDDPELNILRRNYDNQKITVYGKLPKESIKIPRYDHGTTTPDFIFKIEEYRKKPKYLMVETKAKNRRESDNQIVKIQEKYFKQLHESGIYYMMATSDQEVQEELRKIQNEEK